MNTFSKHALNSNNDIYYLITQIGEEICWVISTTKSFTFSRIYNVKFNTLGGALAKFEEELKKNK